MAKSASGTEIVGKLRQADVLLAQGKTGTEYLYGHDHLYSPAVLFSSSGTVSVRYEYDAYGRRRQYTAGWVPSSLQIWGNYYAFTGRELDYLDGGNLQVMYYRARYYDTDTGRFLQRDPLGIDPAGGNGNPFHPTGQYADGMNGYEYGKSRPLTNNDPYGLTVASSCCEYTVRWLLGRDFQVRDLYQKAQKSRDRNMKPCLKKIQCGKCSDDTMGYYHTKRKQIVVCNENIRASQIKEVLMHELIHAIQCDLSRNCGHCMRKELEAYYYGGSCSNPPPGLSQEEYCLKRAWDSCGSIDFCSGDNWKNYIGRFQFPPDMSDPPRIANRS
ncbi:MAG TPA: RHS repeat-associated core domain-containing protein [Anaerohalosphaeraceae bacterium]|jgi:RHS repeat-associated protein|nr:RHS repeat-associated core domain-containing protein [Anaerohalosphaeraceae bacterium]HQI08429.1 RHS repeat-associated core domain-containing protein [Anaerohalosphaeraceae bacterium]HQJ68821.1 RHS repeat-associated core domain-containing protein [Anaerohalosphaeraceae bacterium]